MDTELVIYRGEGHAFATREAQRDVILRAVRWISGRIDGESRPCARFGDDSRPISSEATN